MNFVDYTNDGDNWYKCGVWNIGNRYKIEIGESEEGAYELPGINDLKNKWILKKYTEGS